MQKNILPGLALAGFWTTQARFQTFKKNVLKKETEQLLP